MNTLFQAVGRVHRLGQSAEQKAGILFQEYSILRWIKCNNVINALPQRAASFHDLLKPLVVAATGDTAESADEDAQAELIQTHAEECLRQMLGQSSSRLGVQALDDLGLPQRDFDRMKARMTPKGRKRETEVTRQGRPSIAIQLPSQQECMFPVRDDKQPGHYKAEESFAPSAGEPLG